MPRKQFHYTGEAPGRLDKILLDYLSTGGTGASRSQIKGWIEAGQVRVDSRPVTKAGAEVRSAAHIEIEIPEPRIPELEPCEMELDLLHDDGELLVLNKPAGLVVHPGAGNRSGTLLNALVARFGPPRAGPIRPWIVHRLDKDTSGVLLIAKNEESHRALSAQFAARTVEKEYRALVLGSPKARSIVDREESGVIESAIGRDPRHRTRMAVRTEGGRKAKTVWQVVERMEYAHLLSLRIETGRTHQIRVHLSSIRAPVYGDRSYGDFTPLPPALRRLHEEFGRQALHAARLTILHPRTGERVSFLAPVPADMRALHRELGGVGTPDIVLTKR